ncbi:FAD-dependent oxidoreductase, partial [candidate division KSB1 bacterium]
MKRSVTAFLHFILVLSLCMCRQQRTYKADIIIYGGTSAAVIAAVQAARMQRSVIIVCPDRHLGGLTSGGLGWTDGGNTAAIGGLAREFYGRVYEHYQNPQAWKWQKKSEFSNRGQGAKALNDDDRTAWTFEPHVAEKIFNEFIREYDIAVHRDEWLERDAGAMVVDGRITAIRMVSGAKFSGKMFIDATYEGDLLAAAGVSYHVGREAKGVYGETWNGVQTGVLHHAHYFSAPIDPYV